MLTLEDKLSLFINKFNCCAQQLESDNFILSCCEWNLKCIGDKIFIAREVRNARMNPLAILLNGKRSDKRVFGYKQDYNVYMCGYYPYLQLEKMFCFPCQTLMDGFYLGFSNDRYREGHRSHLEAFNVGRYLYNKWFKTDFSYKYESYMGEKV